jgi:hypothetical protein
MAAPRNTTTAHVCRTCDGFGEVTINRSARQDPQCEEPALCPNELCFGGWVTWAETDPLVLVARARRLYLRAYRAPTMGRQYRERCIRAFRPVRLPPREPNRFERQMQLDTAAAITNFRGFDAMFRSVFGAQQGAA